MGTRNLTLIQKDGQYKVAQYGQWDGYPEGVGTGVLDALQKIILLGGLDSFAEKVSRLPAFSDEGYKRLWKECGWDGESQNISREAWELFKSRYPYLHRDCAGDDLIPLIDAEKVDGVRLDIQFASDSLMCEWAYVIDLDKGTFEVYKGFNESPLDETDRFHFLGKTDYASGRNYEPIKIAASWSLAALPTTKDFLAKLETTDDEVSAPVTSHPKEDLV